MVDSVSSMKRAWVMSRVKGKNTSIELLVRKFLYHQGFRYRINDKKLPGKPDIVLAKYGTVVFINGCFWHRHPGCPNARMPKSRIDFWTKKFIRNIANDRRNQELLIQQGWNVVVLWECEIRKHFQDTMIKLLGELFHDSGV